MKTAFLLVRGDGDYGSMYFEDNFNADQVYKDMVSEGVKKKTIVFDDGYGDENLYIKIYEFGNVDSDFIDFIVDEFMDYDHMKAKNFFQVEVK